MDNPDVRKHPYVLKAGEGWIYRFGVDFTVKSSEIQTGSGAAILEYTTKPGEEPPRHNHQTEDEMFYVLEGSITFHCGDKSFDLGSGDFVFLPRGIQHGYTIRGTDPVRLLVVTAPVRDGMSGGWKGFVSDMESGQGELIGKPPNESGALL